MTWMMLIGIGIIVMITIVVIGMGSGGPQSDRPQRHTPPANGGGQSSSQTPAVEGEEPAWMANVRSALANNRKIEAIKLYREATGAGLAEAKDAVEKLEL